MKIKCEQTVLLRKKDGGLENLLRIMVEPVVDGNVSLYVGQQKMAFEISGERLKAECWIQEPKEAGTVEIRVEAEKTDVREKFPLRVPRHWELHLVQSSHHDPGYTDLMSHVFQRHYEALDQIIDEMDARQDYPEDVRLRIAIEQYWSLDYYMTHAPKERSDKLVNYIKNGDIELTALYGNLITEQLGHEECYRAMYEAEALAKKCGVRITTACHNDIPGVSWGLCRALCDAGIEFFAPDFPNYYGWGGKGLVSFWSEQEIFGYKGPGACYWKAQDGKRILMWHGSDLQEIYWNPRWIEGILDRLENTPYPYDVLRATVKGAAVDNSCFSTCYADNAREWNEKYAYPHIVTGTNRQFQKALEACIDKKGIPVPEISGEIPGQDYPIGAMSMAGITSAIRRTHAVAAAAEKLLTLDMEDEMVDDQSRLLKELYRDLLLSDDHAYGSQFPAGPAMRGSYWEKGSYAMRAEATAHDLLDKAIASIVDRIAPMDTPLRLLVFNASGMAGNRAVEVAMREFDNCGTIEKESNHNSKILTAYILYNRRRVNPEEQFWRDGRFRLVDLESGREIPYYMDTLAWDDPVLYASESVGLGNGTKRLGIFEEPGGMKQVLKFVAADLPAFGYRCYGLIPSETGGSLGTPEPVSYIDNGIYQIHTDAKGICSIVDLRSGEELLDPACPHRLGELLVRNGRSRDAEKMQVTRMEVKQNDLFGTVDLYGDIDGAHQVRIRLAAWQGVESLNLSVRMLHDAKPLQSMFAAFPFAGKGLRYEGMLSVQEPGKNIVPGGQSDFLTVGDYVAVKGSEILWSSRDTGVVALSHLWPGYISPAHSCVMEQEQHEPLTGEAFDTGWIYAVLSANNFGTNFMCSQVFDGVYGFSFGCSQKGDAANALWGEREQMPVITQFTDRSRGTLPPVASMLDTGRLKCLILKKAEDGNGRIVRLWNHSDQEEEICISINGQKVTEWELCDALERKIETGCGNRRMAAPFSVVTVRIW